MNRPAKTLKEVMNTPIPDLWHLAMYLKELDGQTMTLEELRAMRINGQSVADAILNTWTISHLLKQHVLILKGK